MCTTDDGFMFKEISLVQLNDVFALEKESFSEEEADSYDIYVYRYKEAPDLQLGCFLSCDLVGFICATRYKGKNLTVDATKVHNPNGESVCIHSVVVKKEYRGQGIAKKMLKVFVTKVKKEQREVARILLACKPHLIPMYTRSGFVLNGPSVVVYDKDTWYEMQMDLTEKRQMTSRLQKS